jgi:lipoprotein NlpD
MKAHETVKGVGLTRIGGARVALGLASLLVLVACTTPPHRAPVEERTAAPRPAAAVASMPAASGALEGEAAKTAPGADNAQKPGYYTVKPGDTLIRIALENGQNWKDLVKWNGLDNPNVIEVGQALRVVPPGVDPTLAATRPVTVARVETRPLAAPAAAGPAASAATPTAAPSAAAPSAPALVTTTPAAGTTSASGTPASDDDIRWSWPANGAVRVPFEEGKAKGLGIAGKAGDPVFAAADGRVVYAGSGLRGYGNLVILKHNATYLTAYAHNQALLVKEDQNVKRGQKIAEMGSTDSDGVQLHFEIRKQGKPIDPAKLLPPR